MRYPMQISGRGCAFAAGLMILALAALPADAGKQTRVTPINGKSGVRSVVQGRSQSDSPAPVSGFAHLRGHAEYSRSSGLVLAGRRVHLNRATSVFPDLDGMSSGLQPGQLAGRELTVFGKVTEQGVEAVLVIVQPTGSSIDKTSAGPANDPHFIASPTDPRVGKLERDTPN